MSRFLGRLNKAHLFEFERDGRAKRPTVWYDAIEVDLSLTDADPDAVRA
ncbi:hypothetical protein [Natrinema gelatinilyticum]|nr:hypothetical protein [Natrinema gelatinilyticum]